MPLADLTDREIIEKLLELENDNLFERTYQQYAETLYNRYYKDGINLALFWGLKASDAQDVVQISFLRVFKSLKRFKINCEFKPWFIKILRNQVYDRYKLLKKTRYQSIETLKKKQDEEFFEKFHENQYIQSIISKLPQKLKEVVILRNTVDLEYSEISKIIHLSVRQIHNRLNSAYAIIKAELDSKEKDHD